MKRHPIRKKAPPNSFIPKKKFGQNFLVNHRIRQKIVTACELQPTDFVLEVGAGKGALTGAIAEKAEHVYAIETDPVLVEQLRKIFKDKNITVIHADILTYPFESLPDKIKVIGNLPYNIATPVIEKVLKYRKKFSSFYMTVQWEYGKRLVAQPSSKDYGSLSCFVQYYAQAQMLFKIKNTAFDPTPKVESCFIKLSLKPRPPAMTVNEDFLFKVIRQAFGQRRKTILNSLSSLFDKNELMGILDSLGINPQSRAENVNLKDYVRLADCLNKLERGKRGITGQSSL